MTKQKSRVGDECWFVEWVYELVWVDGDDTSEYREIDRDNCKTRSRKVSTKEEAERLAREVWPQTHDAFGVVQYWPAQFVAYDEEDAGRYPHVGYWEATDEGECFEGE
jgi:hypothetical protein